MERLTKERNGITGLTACFELCNHPNSGCDCVLVHSALKKLAEYEDAEEQGLLVRLPCYEDEVESDIEWDVTRAAAHFAAWIAQKEAQVQALGIEVDDD